MSGPDSREDPSAYRTFEHTADLGIEVEGADMRRVLERAGLALFDQIVPLSSVERAIEVDVAAAAPDRDALLVHWLQELHALFTVHHLLVREIAVTAVELHAARCQARGCARGEPFDAERHTPGPEVKAVTYHAARVEDRGNRLVARFIIDR